MLDSSRSDLLPYKFHVTYAQRSATIPKRTRVKAFTPEPTATIKEPWLACRPMLTLYTIKGGEEEKSRY
jgi:hypothetical protein